MPFYCGKCEDSFDTEEDFRNHNIDHPDAKASPSNCLTCGWIFSDGLALEAHQLISGHAIISCDRCSENFNTPGQYTMHRDWSSGPCSDDSLRKKAAAAKQSSASPTKAPQPILYPGLDELTAAKNRALPYHDLSNMMSKTTLDDDDSIQCSECRKIFRSRGQYNRHFLGCQAVLVRDTDAPMVTLTSPQVLSSKQPHHVQNAKTPVFVSKKNDSAKSVPTENVHLKGKLPVPHQQPLASKATLTSKAHVLPAPATVSEPRAGEFHCGVSGCIKKFKSELAVKAHRGDVHGPKEQKLGYKGKKAEMPVQQESGRVKLEGLLKGLSVSPRAQDARQPPAPAHPGPRQPTRDAHPTAHQQTMPNTHQHTLATTPVMQPTSQQAPQNPPPTAGGPADMLQAKSIAGKIRRLLIQTDIYIKHDGTISVSGIDWTRIDTQSQQGVVARFEKMVHLPSRVQYEFDVPFPLAFMKECKYIYPHKEFETSPIRDPLKPGLGVVALVCNKLKLESGAQEVVKIGAVDLITGQILLTHFVCTSGQLAVADWRTESTGLSSWKDMEKARLSGFKIIRGWSAARAALHKFVDRDTILVGHNLRMDLDSLRMTHGRGIDVAILFEKAAKGPLTKSQLGLDKLSKDFTKKLLKTDPKFGRDVICDTFAARQIALWACKYEDELKKLATEMSQDLQSAGVTA